MPVQAPDPEGVLTPSAKSAYRTMAFVLGWFVAGVCAAVAVFSILGARSAQAASTSVDLKLEQLIGDMAQVKRQLAVIGCRLNIDNQCPPN